VDGKNFMVIWQHEEGKVSHHKQQVKKKCRGCIFALLVIVMKELADVAFDVLCSVW
jgi:hypothetical protein